ncbi:MAG TPA: urate hydroxylase PuuD, partial [Elusimicrobiota bacterium]|nr:urate hydroxylase PuuD [Elusimicrobiota bacterium]
SIDDATKKAVNAKLVLRALWWFRWGAMITFLAGLVLFTINYMYIPGMGFGPSALFVDGSGLTQRAVWILMGMLFGTIMWFNVWFIIWPTNKAIFAGQVAADQLPAARAKAALFSRINTYLSGPMLYGMLGAQHYTQINFVTVVIFVALGLWPIWHMYGISKKVGLQAA